MSSYPALLQSLFLSEYGVYFLKWWGTIVLLGAIATPLTRFFLGGLPDRGYPFARVIGWVLPALLVFLASILGLVPFTRASAIVSVALFGLLSLAALPAIRRDRLRPALPSATTVLTAEYLFLVCLVGWTFVRSFRPDIEGLEKFMDFGFVNAALRTDLMPPVDMWLAGEPINYYYFGHYLTAFMIRLTGVPPEVGYNLMMATLFALAFTLAYSLGSNLTARFSSDRSRIATLAGLLAACLLALGGNLHGFIFGDLLPAAKERGLVSLELKPYHYPDATRFIGYYPKETDDRTIHEFPVYSFVVSDLHGHVLDIPIVLTALACCLAAILAARRTAGHGQPRAPSLRSFRISPVEWLLAPLLSVIWMTNSWDFPIVTGVAAGSMLLARLRAHPTLRSAVEGVVAALVVTACAVGLSIPFTLRFVNITQGVHAALSRSPLWQLAVLWGYQGFFAACLLVFLLARSVAILRRRNGTGRIAALLTRHNPKDLFVLGLAVAGALLVLLPELIYVKDIYGTTYHRSNTMFKLTYHAFMLLALVSAYAAFRLPASASRWKKGALALLFGCVAVLPMTYPWKAMNGFYARPTPATYRKLDGLAFLPPEDRAAIRWLNDNVRGAPVVLESDGDSYTLFGRVSMATGLPTVLGWFAHEWLWRGSADIPQKRSAEVRAVYEAASPDTARKILDAYRVEYLVIGERERSRFPNMKEAVLHSLGESVFRSGNTEILRIAPAHGAIRGERTKTSP